MCVLMCVCAAFVYDIYVYVRACFFQAYTCLPYVPLEIAPSYWSKESFLDSCPLGGVEFKEL